MDQGGAGPSRAPGLRGLRGKIVSAAARSAEPAPRMQQSAADRTQGAEAAASGADLLSFSPLAGNEPNIKLDTPLPEAVAKQASRAAAGRVTGSRGGCRVANWQLHSS